MTEEEAIKGIERLIKWFEKWNEDYVLVPEDKVYFETVLNLIQKQQEELEKLRNKNNDLLRKLRNRVKEVKKLTKYSLYKNEFTRLNKQIEKKDKQIDLMADEICFKEPLKYTTAQEVKEYFKKKVED